MKRKATVLLVWTLTAFVFVLLDASDAFAQCAMCKTAVAAGGEKTARTMNIAMLVLLVPPVTIFCSVFALVYKYRNPRAEADN